MNLTRYIRNVGNREMDKKKDSKEKPVVSVITPCYNGERFMAQWASCIAEQSYPSVEVIFVNDGSKDGSKEAFEKESLKIKERGYSVRYLEKSNGGAADAVNIGLKYVTGAYIMLFDMDDILFRDAISEKADYLTAHDDIGLVRNNGYAVREHNLDDRSVLFGDGEDKNNPHIFESFLKMKISPYPGSYMIRTKALFAHLKDKNIYISPYGQNLPMMIAVAYFEKAAYIDKPLMKYIHYKNSHSHAASFEKKLELYNGYECNTIGSVNLLDIPEAEKTKHIATVKNAYYEGRFLIGIHYRKRELIREQYGLMKKQGLATSKTTGMLLFSYLPFGCFAIKSYPRFKRLVKRILYRLSGIGGH